MASDDTLPAGWQMVIGLEVHAQISSASKLFSGAATAFGANANEQVSFIDGALPGMLPCLNMLCVEKAIMSAHALGGEVNRHSVFERKNYFYADLPQGYQISQLQEPLMRGGKITISSEDVASKDIAIERMHMEQDAGKSLHDMLVGKTCVDLNRSGVALMEIVSQPEMHSPDEASLYVAKLRSILRAIGACDGNMQEGSLRVDANVSVRREDAALGTRCEIKNLNSLRFMRQAIAYEVRRQLAIIDAGGEVAQETRLFDADKGETRSMRSKEEAHDYRYFPDPDIPPLVLSAEYIASLKAGLPELPDARIARFIAEHGLSLYEASLLAEDSYIAIYFEDLVGKVEGLSAKAVANWMAGELFARVKEHDVDLSKLVSDFGLSATRAASLLSLIGLDKISARAGKVILDKMLEDSTASAASLVEKLGLQQLGDTKELSPLLEKLLAENSEQVVAYRDGKAAVFGWFMGQAMQLTKGRADPKVLSRLLRELLSGNKK